MIEWQHPWFLAGLLLLPVLVWWRHQGRSLFRFSSLSLLQRGRSLRILLAPVPEGLLLLGLGALLVAMARPQLTHRETVVESEGIDIMLVLDVSGSMESPDYRVGGRRASRLAVAKAVMARFIEGRQYDRVGLVVFGEEAFTQVPLTLDHDALVTFLREVDIGMAGKRSTAIGDALAVASNRLKDLQAPSKVVILLTDGRNNAGRLEPEQAAEAAATFGITIYTIGVGSNEGGLRGFFGAASGGDLDEQLLRQVAAATDGYYFRAQDTETLEQVYATIDEMEKSTAEVTEFVRREERYRPWLLLGLSLVVVHILLSTTWLRRLP